MLKKISVILSISLFLLNIFAFSQTTDSINISTYYPSPNGIYKSLRLVPSAQGTCDSENEGEMYYDADSHTLSQCSYDGSNYVWSLRLGDTLDLKGASFPGDPAGTLKNVSTVYMDNGELVLTHFAQGNPSHPDFDITEVISTIVATDYLISKNLGPNKVIIGTAPPISGVPYPSYGASVSGDLDVSGDLAVSGAITATTKSFLIDHPLDPQNKILRHFSVESSDLKNIYDGITVLDENGEAVINLPDYFQPLNRSYRYQLTPIGGYAPLYIKEEICDNKFMISGGRKGLKVSWQVTGVRDDAFARKNPLLVEEDKNQSNGCKKGEYINPEAFE